MSVEENSIKYDGDNTGPIIIFLKRLKTTDMVGITKSDSPKEIFTIVTKNDITILLKNRDTYLNIIYNMIQDNNIIDIGSLISLENTTDQSEDESSEISQIEEKSVEVESAVIDESIEVADDLYDNAPSIQDNIDIESNDDLYEDNIDLSQYDFTIVTTNIDAEILEKKETVSKWEQKQSENENRQIIIDMLNEIYQNKRDVYSVHNESEIYLNLQKKCKKFSQTGPKKRGFWKILIKKL